MEYLKKQVEQILLAYDPNAVVELEEVPLARKLSGQVVLQKFSEMGHRERQRLLRTVLQQGAGDVTGLSEEQQLGLSLLLTLSPAEYRAYQNHSLEYA